MIAVGSLRSPEQDLYAHPKGWAYIEDLGSKNGTSLRGRSITRREQLTDGDAISLGGVLLVFRTPSGDRSTRTWKKPKRS